MFLWKYRIYEHVSFCLVRVDNIISCICACPHVCGYTCICVCEDMNLMSAVFLNCFSPCSLRYSLSRNQELTDLTALASLLVSDPLCLPREPGLWAVTTPAQLFMWVLRICTPVFILVRPQLYPLGHVSSRHHPCLFDCFGNQISLLAGIKFDILLLKPLHCKITGTTACLSLTLAIINKNNRFPGNMED